MNGEIVKKLLIVTTAILSTSNAIASQNCKLLRVDTKDALFGVKDSVYFTYDASSIDECISNAKKLLGSKFNGCSYGVGPGRNVSFACTTTKVTFTFDDVEVQVTGKVTEAKK